MGGNLRQEWSEYAREKKACDQDTQDLLCQITSTSKRVRIVFSGINLRLAENWGRFGGGAKEFFKRPLYEAEGNSSASHFTE
jgi:hypothetical protein